MAGLRRRAICSYDVRGGWQACVGELSVAMMGREGWQACVGELSVAMMGGKDGRPVSETYL